MNPDLDLTLRARHPRPARGCGTRGPTPPASRRGGCLRRRGAASSGWTSRPGGAFVTSMSDDGIEFVPHLDACFLAVDDGERIVFTNAVDSRWRPATPEPIAMTAEIISATTPTAPTTGWSCGTATRRPAPGTRSLASSTAGAPSPSSSPRSSSAEGPMRLTLTQFVTLDGVYQGPGSPEKDPSDGFTRGGWMVPHMDPTFIAQAAAWLAEPTPCCSAAAPTRRSPALAPITDPDDPFTERMNGLPKYVASNTLDRRDVVRRRPCCAATVAAVAALKARPGASCSPRLGPARAALLAAGLIDEVRLVVTPTASARAAGCSPTPARASACGSCTTRRPSTGLLLLEYATTGAAPVADYRGVPAQARPQT